MESVLLVSKRGQSLMQEVGMWRKSISSDGFSEDQLRKGKSFLSIVLKEIKNVESQQSVIDECQRRNPGNRVFIQKTTDLKQYKVGLRLMLGAVQGRKASLLCQNKRWFMQKS